MLVENTWPSFPPLVDFAVSPMTVAELSSISSPCCVLCSLECLRGGGGIMLPSVAERSCSMGGGELEGDACCFSADMMTLLQYYTLIYGRVMDMTDQNGNMGRDEEVR